MNLLWKVAIAVAALLTLPLSAYAVGNLVASPEGPAPRQDIEITEVPRPTSTSGPSKVAPKPSSKPSGTTPPADTDEDRDDGVRVVTPRPAPVDARGGGDDTGADDDDDDDRGGDDDGDDRGDDDDD